VSVETAELEAAVEFFLAGDTVVLSGAGLSTDSGIPDYRGPNGTLKRRLPMQYKEFTAGAEARRRYWARSAIGWTYMKAVAPNSGHRALAELERMGLVSGIITQNVDGLHSGAGSTHCIELHGSLSRVVCLDCGRYEGREALQARILACNPGWDEQAAVVRPDGDVELDESQVPSFSVPPCSYCGGVLKPDVVFFGENVPRPRVDEAFSLLSRSRRLAVVGSSLTVYSGFRFVDRAAKDGKPILILNDGKTRGDSLASLRISHRITPILEGLLTEIASSYSRKASGPG
jgi:NAD-dependent SIR2 family protein deacetylase